MMNDAVECTKCGTICQVDGEFPKFDAWCDVCHDYATCDMSEYTTDWFASKIDEAYERRKYER